MPSLSITKRMLWRHVNIRINRLIHSFHVFSIINILFDEMFQDLKQGKIVEINNFGTFELKHIKPHKYFNPRQQKVVMQRPRKSLRFTMSEKISKKITEHVDLDRSINGD
jgi:nucleoid DNA-binding protein